MAPFIDYEGFSRKVLSGGVNICNFINAQILSDPIDYTTYKRRYRPLLRRAGVVRRDRANGKDVCVPYQLGKYWEENLLRPVDDE